MKRVGRFCRLTAAILTAGIIFSTQGLTAAAGTTGIGAASSEQTGPGAAGQAEGQAGQAEGQGQAGQAEGQEQAAPPVQPENPLQVNYSAFVVQQGWSAVTADNHPCAAGAGAWVTSIRANLIQIPEGAQVGIRYQVNLSGSGWLPWSEDGAEAGGAEGVMPLESIRMELTGSAAAN